MVTEVVSLLRSIDAKVGRIADSLAALEKVEESKRYTKREAARVLGCSVKTVERRLKDGSLTASETAGRKRINGGSLKRFVHADDGRRAVSVLRI